MSDFFPVFRISSFRVPPPAEAPLKGDRPHGATRWPLQAVLLVPPHDGGSDPGIPARAVARRLRPQDSRAHARGLRGPSLPPEAGGLPLASPRPEAGWHFDVLIHSSRISVEAAT